MDGFMRLPEEGGDEKAESKRGLLYSEKCR